MEIKSDLCRNITNLVKFLLGPLAVGVPGELKGYWDAHKRFGKLTWKEIVQPSIELCEEGYQITAVQYDSIKRDEEYIRKDENLRWCTV